MQVNKDHITILPPVGDGMGPDGKGPWAPKTDWYRFAEFAHWVVEMGGYSDLTLVNPYDGRRLHLAWAMLDDNEEPFRNPWDGLRKLIDAAEMVDFTSRTGEDASVTEAARDTANAAAAAETQTS
jgi:hypothetical protein